MPIENVIEALEKPAPEKKLSFWKEPKNIFLLDALGKQLDPENPMAGIGTTLTKMEMGKQEQKSKAARSQISNLIDAYKAKTSIASSEVAMKQSIYDLQQEKAGDELHTITDSISGRSFQIPKRDLVTATKIMSEIKRNDTLNKLTAEEVKQVRKTMPIIDNFGNKHNVSQQYFKEISDAIAKRKQEDEEAKVVKIYKNTPISQMSNMSISHYAILGGQGGMAALANKIDSFGEDKLTPNEEMRATDMQYNLGDLLLKQKDPPESANISTYNNLCKKLRSDHMMLKIPKKISWGRDTTQAVMVPLPPGKTAKDVYNIAAEKKISINEVLRNIYIRLPEDSLN